MCYHLKLHAQSFGNAIHEIDIQLAKAGTAIDKVLILHFNCFKMNENHSLNRKTKIKNLNRNKEVKF